MPSPSYTCPSCGRTSHHPKDVEHRYCGHCHVFEGDAERQALVDRLLRQRVGLDTVTDEFNRLTTIPEPTS